MEVYDHKLHTAAEFDLVIFAAARECMMVRDNTRIDMIDLLMQQLTEVFPLFSRKRIEGIGIYDWADGFNPYWVYEKYGFKEMEKLAENTVVMSKTIK